MCKLKVGKHTNQIGSMAKFWFLLKPKEMNILQALI